MATVSQPLELADFAIHGKPRGLWTQAFFRLVRNRLAIVAAVLLLSVLLVSVGGDVTTLVSHHPPAELRGE